MDLVKALLEWYGREARDLPWRRTRDPYAILVSEVMLQQTQVARVIPRYEAWLQRWPHPAALAAATPADVLAEWVGLGYNRRALRLREACAVVARDGWPEDLSTLPGVGPYTAAAVGAFAFDRDVAAVDTNVARVAARWGAGAPQELVPAGQGAAFNHAMMDLGATVCRARAPRCSACPVAAGCASAHRVASTPRAAAGSRERFEDSNRWVRGRIVEALATGGRLPEVDPSRLERAVDGLVADGLVVRTGTRLALAH